LVHAARERRGIPGQVQRQIRAPGAASRAQRAAGRPAGVPDAVIDVDKFWPASDGRVSESGWPAHTRCAWSLTPRPALAGVWRVSTKIVLKHVTRRMIT